MAEFFDLDISLIGGGVSAVHVGALISQLPQNSRVIRKYNPQAEWSANDYLTAELINTARQQLYVAAKSAGAKQFPAPEAVELPGSGKRRDNVVMTSDDITRKLTAKRE